MQILSVKEEVKQLLDNLPEDCTAEDVQYHLYVAEKVKHSLSRAETEGTTSQQTVEQQFSAWL